MKRVRAKIGVAEAVVDTAVAAVAAVAEAEAEAATSANGATGNC